MKPKKADKAGKPKRPRTGGPAPRAFALKEFLGVTLGRAMTMATEGRAHDADAEGVAHALAACLQYRQRPDVQEPDFADAKDRCRFLSGTIRHSKSKEAAAEFETLAAQTVIQWLLKGAMEDKDVLPKRLRLLANLLESRPLKYDAGVGHQCILPAPAMPEALAVLSLGFEALFRLSNRGHDGVTKQGEQRHSIRELQEAVAGIPIEERLACLHRYCPGLDEHRARKLLNQLWGIKFPKGAPKKTA